MTLEVRKHACDGQRADFFTLALLLAEGQTGSGSERWPALIDQLAQITDAFANARARSTKPKGARRILASV